MSYLRTGRAERWAARIHRWEERPENAGCLRFFGWEDFREEFRREFTPLHADVEARNHLESDGYHQQHRSLDDYMDDFLELIADSGYSDPRIVVIKFCRGLDPRIQNVVATMASGRPSDSSPEQWYSAAWMVYEKQVANEAFLAAPESHFESEAQPPVVVAAAEPSEGFDTQKIPLERL
jgi:hypothetical protein